MIDPPPFRSFRRGLTQVIVNPFATIVLLGALVALVVCVPPLTPPHYSPTRLARWWDSRQSRTYYPVMASVFLVRDGARETLHDPDTESWDEMTRILAEGASAVTRVDVRVGVTRSGVWAPTREQSALTFETQQIAPGATPIPGGAAIGGDPRAMAAESIAVRREAESPDLAAVLRGSPGISRRTLWSGYVYDAATIITIVLLGWSLAWVPGAVRFIRAGRGGRRLARGRCPTCNYSFAGLPRDTCPECGGALPADRAR